jgi:hypothetical protein
LEKNVGQKGQKGRHPFWKTLPQESLKPLRSRKAESVKALETKDERGTAQEKNLDGGKNEEKPLKTKSSREHTAPIRSKPPNSN